MWWDMQEGERRWQTPIQEYGWQCRWEGKTRQQVGLWEPYLRGQGGPYPSNILFLMIVSHPCMGFISSCLRLLPDLMLLFFFFFKCMLLQH